MDFPKALHVGFQVFDDLGSENVGIGKVVQIGEALVLDPGDVEAGLVVGEDFYNEPR